MIGYDNKKDSDFYQILIWNVFGLSIFETSERYDMIMIGYDNKKNSDFYQILIWNVFGLSIF